MIKVILLTLVFWMVSLHSFGQNGSNDWESTYQSYAEKYNVVDTAYMEVVYAHSIFDPVLKKKNLVYEILSMGSSNSNYIDYSSYKADSIGNMRAGEKYRFFEWINGASKELSAVYGRSRERVMKNYQDSVMHFEGYMMGRYYYEEPMHQMEWTLGDETKEILGYECRKATCHWRGRDWTAWYSELPYSDGPWIFGGLPGLIMELTDATGEHKIRAKGIKRDVYPFGLSKRRSDFRTKRERYRKMLADYCENAAAKLMESGMVTKGLEKQAAKPRRLFYCPLELE